MRLGLAAGLVCLAVWALPVPSAYGMQFESIQVSPTEIVIGGRGPIVPGDTERMMRALSSVPQVGQSLLALALDSGGGDVAEAKQMVGVIQSRQLQVVIPHSSKCASACFLLLAASPRRFAAIDALVGVHSASQSGADTETSLAVTTLMARDAAELGVPASIIGKMVATTPGRVEWLDPHDLASMKVTVFDGDVVAVLHQPDPAAGQRTLSAALPPAQANPSQANPSPAYAAGQQDHLAWDAWLAGLRGRYREGAMFAQSQISAADPASCYGPNNVNRGDFTQGCDVARHRLAPLVAKMRSSPDYASGWNRPVQPVSAGDAVEQEYQGVYYCAAQVAHLTLKVFQRSNEPRRRALFVFGPHDAGSAVPRGSFIVEGSIDTSGGVMTLAPVKWVSQPPGYQLLGLSGRSDDGGKTFGGRVTDNSTCTRFTLERTSNATAVK
jgi:ATP-dependent protease ClpP protease subunit